jgi:hypothetical protein
VKRIPPSANGLDEAVLKKGGTGVSPVLAQAKARGYRFSNMFAPMFLMARSFSETLLNATGTYD